MPDRLIERAIEALESKKAAIDAEIAAFRGLRPARRRRPVRATGKAGKRPHMSAAARKAQSERMKARWAEWRAERAKKAKVSRTKSPAQRKHPEIKCALRKHYGHSSNSRLASVPYMGYFWLPRNTGRLREGAGNGADSAYAKEA